MEDKMLGFQNKIEEIDITVKLLSLKKNPDIKHSGNLEYHEKIKFKKKYK